MNDEVGSARRVTEAGDEGAWDEDELRGEGRAGEYPEREWNQYVEASVCPWPHMRVSVPGEAKHASFYAR